MLQCDYKTDIFKSITNKNAPLIKIYTYIYIYIYNLENFLLNIFHACTIFYNSFLQIKRTIFKVKEEYFIVRRKTFDYFFLISRNNFNMFFEIVLHIHGVFEVIGQTLRGGRTHHKDSELQRNPCP